jgi:ketosteroid isomerase-like protein
MTENEVREAYERLVGAFREGRDKFGSFADDATIIDGGRWFGSLAEYRTAWEAWVAVHGPIVPDSVETRILDLRVLGDTAVLIHSIESRERAASTVEMEHEIETIVFGRRSDGRWLVIHQHLSPQPS